MVEKIIDFLWKVGMNGLVAIFVAVVYYIIAALTLVVVMIPVSIIFGSAIAERILNFAGNDLGYKVAYILAFIMLMLDDLGVPNIKALYLRWKNRRAKTQKVN